MESAPWTFDDSSAISDRATTTMEGEQGPAHHAPAEGGGARESSQPPAKRKKQRLPGEPPRVRPGPQACESCGTTGSPEWRKGPTGQKTLCNACGLRYSRSVNKDKKRAEGGEGASGGKRKKGAPKASTSASAAPPEAPASGAVSAATQAPVSTFSPEHPVAHDASRSVTTSAMTEYSAPSANSYHMPEVPTTSLADHYHQVQAPVHHTTMSAESYGMTAMTTGPPISQSAPAPVGQSYYNFPPTNTYSRSYQHGYTPGMPLPPYWSNPPPASAPSYQSSIPSLNGHMSLGSSDRDGYAPQSASRTSQQEPNGRASYESEHPYSAPPRNPYDHQVQYQQPQYDGHSRYDHEGQHYQGHYDYQHRQHEASVGYHDHQQSQGPYQPKRSPYVPNHSSDESPHHAYSNHTSRGPTPLPSPSGASHVPGLSAPQSQHTPQQEVEGQQPPMTHSTHSVNAIPESRNGTSLPYPPYWTTDQNLKRKLV